MERSTPPAKPYAITLDVGSSLANKTGNWRTERAEYVDRLPPCNNACPAGENIQAWLYEAEEGGEGYERAWRKLVEDNPFPAIMGRVCYHPCETACNRGQLDEAVGIHAVERFLGDEAIAKGWTFEAPPEPSGKRVLVVGAGPSGLSAAYHLTRLGHSVTIHEAGPMAGGMMRFGIPTYRLPRDVLDAEVARILAMGVELELDRKVTDIEEAMAAGGFDAAFLAVGAHIGRHAEIPAGEAARIVDAVSVLESMEGKEKPLLGRRVVVYGGGNTAMDAARTAKRLGATDAVVVYRRNRERMPAHEFEVSEAEEEGVMMRWLETIKQVDGGKVAVEKMELDDTGFPQPTGEFDELEADSVILALGQDADLSLLEGVSGVEVSDGVVSVGPNMMTGHEGVFAGGDMVPAERTVTVGVGHGKKAARNIDGWLRDADYAPPPKSEVISFEELNTWYFADAPRSVQPQLETERRRSTFEEVVAGLDIATALYEARRCMSCGHCFSCDNCYGVCPDNAVIKLGDPGELYKIDLDFCKGCGLCAEECPSGAIEMIPEAICSSVAALEEVPIPATSPERFAEIIGSDYERVVKATETAHELLDGRVIWHINSTARGGGVAEMLHSLLAYARGAGVNARWLTVSGNKDFFHVTKRIHNRLHNSPGDGGELGKRERDVYNAALREAARELVDLVREGDVVYLHDPQTAGLVPHVKSREVSVVWRCHIGVDKPGDLARQTWDFLRQDVEDADAYVFSRREFIWDGLEAEKVWLVPPSIDAFSPKNQDLDGETVDAILATIGLSEDGGRPIFRRHDGSSARVDRAADIDQDAPIPAGAPVVAQVSRWDHLKDPVGVLHSFTEHTRTPGAHLVLAGPAASAISDDPEGADVLAEVRGARAELGDELRGRVHLVSLPMDDIEENAVMVNAIQRRADVVVQKSLAEGFGLTVAEAMWKSRPVVASAVGGIQDQIVDGESGVLLADPTDLSAAGQAIDGLLGDHARAVAMGTAARERVRSNFLGTRHLVQYMELISQMLATQGDELSAKP